MGSTRPLHAAQRSSGLQSNNTLFKGRSCTEPHDDILQLHVLVEEDERVGLILVDP